jgi:protein-tyrosine phosphatase
MANRFRSFMSHPATLSHSCLYIENHSFNPMKFTSSPELLLPPAKLVHAQASVESTHSPAIETVDLSTAQVCVRLINPSVLADKLHEQLQIMIFDCGSSLRHNDKRLSNAIVLPVSDRISRKRFKTNARKGLLFDIKQLNQCDIIVLYDDTFNEQYSNQSCEEEIHLSDNDRQLSAGIKCACEQIQNCLNERYPSIFILNCSFEQFYDLFPNECQSFNVLSRTSSLMHVSDIMSCSSIRQMPPTGAIMSPTLISQHELNTYPMTHIYQGLFIGNELNAKNLDELILARIEYIVNVTSHLPLYHNERIKYCRLPADDTCQQNLSDYFDQAYTFIKHAIDNKSKVLVHCVAGISRSPAIVMSFLMRSAHMSMNDAYELVKSKRSIIAPNLNFMGQLLQYEKKLREDN